MIMRKCDCGTIATTEEDLGLFEKDSNSKFGRRNRCKVCSAKKVTGTLSPKEKSMTCSSCKETYHSQLAIYKMFRRVPPTGDLVVGNLSRVCKTCEAKALIESGVELVELDGRLIPKDMNSMLKHIRISSKSLEAVEVPIGILERIKLKG